MRSLFENKRLVLVLAAFALVALTVLAVSLQEIPFREAQRFSREEVEPPPISVDQVPLRLPSVSVWKQVLFWVLLSLLAVLIGLLFSPQFRKRLFLLLIRVGFTVWAIYYLFKNFGPQLLAAFAQQPPQGTETDSGSFTPMPVFEPPQVSSTLSYVISFGFALFLLVLVWALYRGWKRYLLLNSRPLDEIARIARSSLEDLSSGRNSSDVIINCYLRMSDVVSNKRHLYREIAMTPHEFAARLEQAGLPGDAVSRLTRLFEGVRYGDRKSGPRDVNEAVSCLKTILHYCGEPI